MIRLNQVSKTYRTDKVETLALKDIDLVVERGEFVALMGPSGCGKSTLLNLIGLLDRPSQGAIDVDGIPIKRYADRQLAKLRNQTFGFIFQSFHLIQDLRVIDNVELPLLYRSVSGGERRRLAREALARVGLSARMDHYPNQLSGGQQQRVAIARATLERNEKLRSSGLVSGENLLTAQLNVKRTEIQLRQQRALLAATHRTTATNIAAADLQKAILQKQIAQQEQLLDRTRVRAPFGGMLTWLLEEEGASVSAGQLVARVSELNNYRVEATLSDFHARQLAPGQAVRVEQNGEVMAGTVHTILPEIQNGTIKLLVDLAQPRNPHLRNKMRVDVAVVTERRANVLVVDSGPAFNGRGPQPAFVVRDGVARRTTLDLGAGDGKVVEVVAGAHAGDRVVVSDTADFKHRDSIRITN